MGPDDAGDWRRGLKPGDRVRLLRDDGAVTEHEVWHAPTRLYSGEWVAWLSGIIGCYQLSRVLAAVPADPVPTHELGGESG
jgi:hypothetical protein